LVTSNEPVRFIVDEPGYDTETGIKGRGYSPNNGKTFLVQNTTKGRIFRQLDGDRIWPFLKDKVRSAMSLNWDDIQDKPRLVTPEQLEQRLAKLNIPTTLSWNQITDKPTIPSIDGLATTSALGEVKSTAESAKSIAEKAQSTADANTESIKTISLTPGPQGPKGDRGPQGPSGKDATITIDSSSQNTNKKPSEYPEGIFHEVKDVSTLGIVRTPADFAPEGRQGTTAFVTTMSYGGMAHQTVDIVDSKKPMRFCRNGKGNTWYRWEWSTTD
jgi:hypothetical protein